MCIRDRFKSVKGTSVLLSIVIALLVGMVLLLNLMVLCVVLWMLLKWLLGAVRARAVQARTSTAVVLSFVLLAGCRWVLDPEQAFVHSFFPVHFSAGGYNQELFELTDIHQTPLLDAHTCDQIVRAANEYTAVANWTTNRHSSYATTDIPFQVLPEQHSAFMRTFHAQIASIVATRIFKSRWGFGSFLRPLDFFVVKYSAQKEAQRSLAVHRDGGDWSFIIVLTQPGTDFTGGGTRYHLDRTEEQHKAERGPSRCEAQEEPAGDFAAAVVQPAAEQTKGPVGRLQTMSPDKGHMLSHPAPVFHEGLPIDSGERYLLTGFTRVDSTMNDFMWWLMCYVLVRALLELL
eukprot:TRINITY_DN34361_c0_g1_i1.p1 TRINITY_DN34361_c0_g1~~TRINITY_DN34361_c0_g1_i1.p1  ORF type:complete len:346 (+),score=104.34 TRINITY_DN34361_c0_g1_i1:129-1166(+)